MKFAPAPQNEFSEFISTYFERCRSACPLLRGIAGKWEFSDLIPGLSDFDTRFLAANDTTAKDWAEMSLAVGRVHADIARARPRWARMLEHLPGVNLTFAELCDPVLYHPEIRTWTLYYGDEPEITQARKWIANRPWTEEDEHFHLRRFAAYFGPYQRGIDPPINVGPFENKYALHSRYMHYFAPPVQAAVSLALRWTVRGKLDALRRAREIFPNPQIVDSVLEAVERHYEVPERYEETELAHIERTLERYLTMIRQELAPHVTVIKLNPADSPTELQQAVRCLSSDPLARFLNTARYARLMRGRLMFFAETIPWFKTPWLIQNELRRMANWFCWQPLAVWDEVRLEGGLSAAECEAFCRLATIADASVPKGAEKAQARAAAENFEPVQLALERLAAQLRMAVSHAALL